ncbi:MAG: hypothetical protein KAR32_10275, partial [Candidatus Omnitrophica bacterium]|nr:hypothetical protein [Candidatus Omnitrophota bacterium]
MHKKLSNENNICLILPKTSRFYRFIKILYKHLGVKVFYHADFDEELISPIPSDLFYKSSEVYKTFLQALIGSDSAKRISRMFSLNSNVLIKAGREFLYKKIQFDFYYVFQVIKGMTNTRARVIYPVSGRFQTVLNDCIGAEPHSSLTGFLSSIGSIIEKIYLFTLTFLKTLAFIILIIYWRFTSISKLAKKVKGNFIWIASGPTETSLNPDKLSLPHYLKQLFKYGEFKDKKVGVVCSFLERDKYWDDGISFAIPNLRNLSRGLSNDLFFQGGRDFLKTLINLPFAFFKDGEDLVLLSLLPQLILNKICLQKLEVKAVFMAESCVGWAHPVVHAARDVNIPVIMVCYAANHRAIVLDLENQDIVPVPFQNLLAEYSCVWSEEMREWLINSGYEKRKIHVVGPQMFASVELNSETNKNISDTIKIGLFDITPAKKEVYIKWGKGEDVINADYMLNFRKQVFEVVKKVFGDNFIILLKLKRSVDANNKILVSNWEETVKEALPEFDAHSQHRNPDSNPWKVIDEADIIISMPFTSLSEAGFVMGKPAAYFDPTKLILPRPGGKVPLLSGSEELYNWLCDLKQNKITRRSTGDDHFGPKRLATVLKDI